MPDMFSEDSLFGLAWSFGAVMCAYGLHRGFKDISSGWGSCIPGFAGFMIFPLINTIIGIFVVYQVLKEWLIEMKERNKEENEEQSGRTYGQELTEGNDKIIKIFTDMRERRSKAQTDKDV